MFGQFRKKVIPPSAKSRVKEIFKEKADRRSRNRLDEIEKAQRDLMQACMESVKNTAVTGATQAPPDIQGKSEKVSDTDNNVNQEPAHQVESGDEETTESSENLVPDEQTLINALEAAAQQNTQIKEQENQSQSSDTRTEISSKHAEEAADAGEILPIRHNRYNQQSVASGDLLDEIMFDIVSENIAKRR